MVNKRSQGDTDASRYQVETPSISKCVPTTVRRVDVGSGRAAANNPTPRTAAVGNRAKVKIFSGPIHDTDSSSLLSGWFATTPETGRCLTLLLISSADWFLLSGGGNSISESILWLCRGVSLNARLTTLDSTKPRVYGTRAFG